MISDAVVEFFSTMERNVFCFCWYKVQLNASKMAFSERHENRKKKFLSQ